MKTDTRSPNERFWAPFKSLPTEKQGPAMRRIKKAALGKLGRSIEVPYEQAIRIFQQPGIANSRHEAAQLVSCIGIGQTLPYAQTRDPRHILIRPDVSLVITPYHHGEPLGPENAAPGRVSPEDLTYRFQVMHTGRALLQG